MACLSSQDGTTALFAAALQGRLEAVDRLIAAGAEVNAVNKVVYCTRQEDLSTGTPPPSLLLPHLQIPAPLMSDSSASSISLLLHLNRSRGPWHRVYISFRGPTACFRATCPLGNGRTPSSDGLRWKAWNCAGNSPAQNT
jgi:hypothetical protein